MNLEEERNLINRILDGDRNVYEALVLANQNNVYNLALKMTKSEEDALDISQEVFFKAFRHLHRFRGESKFSVWLYRLTYNLCIDFLRKQQKNKVVSLNKSDDADDTGVIEIPDMRNMPEDSTIRSELRQTMFESIEELPVNYREILVMREITDMSYDDISLVLKLNIGTVKSRLARARLKLANILVKKGTFPQNYRQID